MTCLIWSHRRPFFGFLHYDIPFRDNCCSKVWPNNCICKQLPSLVPKKEVLRCFLRKKLAENSHSSVHEWSKWYTFSTFVVPLSLGFLFQQFSPSLFGETAVSKDFQTDVIIPISKTHLLGAKDFTPKLVAILMIWQVDFFFGNGRISHRWSMIHHRNVLWPYTKVRLPLVVITVLGYIITSWNDLIQNKVVEKVNSFKKNIIKRPFRMLALWM